MASGRTHDTINLMTYSVTTLTYAAATQFGVAPPVPLATFVAGTLGYAAGTLLLSPDLDMMHTLPKKRWGPLKLFWTPYALLMPHRGLSHSYLVGPATRLAYLAVLVTPFLVLPDVRTFLSTHLAPYATPSTLTAAVVGYYASSWMHLIIDKEPLRP